MKDIKKLIDNLIESYKIDDIEELAHSQGFYISEQNLTDDKINYSLNKITEHSKSLKNNPDNYKFHIASIWKLFNDVYR